MSERCEWSDLPAEGCAHCVGHREPGIGRPEPVAISTGLRIWPPATASREEQGGDLYALPDTWAPFDTDGECRCGKPTRDQAFVCDDCAGLLSRALGDVPWLGEQLDLSIAKQQAAGTEFGARSSETALPWHEKAADARRKLHGLLAMWVRFCVEERVRHSSPGRDWPDDNLASLSRWLLWRVDGLTLRDIGPEAVDEITDAVAECHRLIDRRPDRWYAGPCSVEVAEDVICGADLYAKSREGLVKCRACGATYDVAERRRWLIGEAEDRLATAADIARAVSWLGSTPLTAERVRKWAERGRILSKGHDGKRPLYRIGDAIDLLAEDTRKAG